MLFCCRTNAINTGQVSARHDISILLSIRWQSTTCRSIYFESLKSPTHGYGYNMSVQWVNVKYEVMEQLPSPFVFPPISFFSVFFFSSFLYTLFFLFRPIAFISYLLLSFLSYRPSTVASVSGGAF